MYFAGKQKGLILTSTNQDFLRATFGDEITASYGKSVTLRAVHKIVAGRGLDTIVIGLPAHIIPAQYPPKVPAGGRVKGRQRHPQPDPDFTSPKWRRQTPPTWGM